MIYYQIGWLCNFDSLSFLGFGLARPGGCALALRPRPDLKAKTSLSPRKGNKPTGTLQVSRALEYIVMVGNNEPLGNINLLTNDDQDLVLQIWNLHGSSASRAPSKTHQLREPSSKIFHNASGVI